MVVYNGSTASYTSLLGVTSGSTASYISVNCDIIPAENNVYKNLVNIFSNKEKENAS